MPFRQDSCHTPSKLPMDWESAFQKKAGCRASASFYRVIATSFCLKEYAAIGLTRKRIPGLNEAHTFRPMLAGRNRYPA